MTIRFRIGKTITPLTGSLIANANGYETQFTTAGGIFLTWIRYHDKNLAMPLDHAQFYLTEACIKNTEYWIESEVSLDI
ncbi:hypothetical protein BGZ90_008346, partial [Linnemannia elongata]